MGKLMKYEWKKQRTSRMIVMVALAVCVLAFLGGMLVEKDALMGISATLLLVGSFFVVFYMGIESILILNRDLKTKAKLYDLDDSEICMGNSWSKICCSDRTDVFRVCTLCDCRTALFCRDDPVCRRTWKCICDHKR